MGRAGGSEVTPRTGSQPGSKTIPGMGSFGGSEGRPASGRSRGPDTILGMGEPSFREVLAELNAEVNRRVQDVQALEELRITDPNNTLGAGNSHKQHGSSLKGSAACRCRRSAQSHQPVRRRRP